MDNQVPPTNPPSEHAASTPVTPSGTAYTPPPTSPTFSSLPSTPIPPSKNNLWIFVLVAVVIILLGGSGYYYFMNMQQQKPTVSEKVMVKPSPTIIPSATPMATDSVTASDSANWKTYTSLDRTYSIQYPSDTFFRRICPDEELTLEVRREQKEESMTMPTCGRDGLYDIEVITLKQPHIPQQSNENYSILKKESMIDSTPATTYTTTLIKEQEGPSIAFSEDVYVTKNGKYYQIHLGRKDLQSTFDKMLASFKFAK